MLTLGFAAALMAFVSMPRDFYLMRVSLGSAEEGFVSQPSRVSDALIQSIGLG